jgi:hypothetical protein
MFKQVCYLNKYYLEFTCLGKKVNKNGKISDRNNSFGIV